MKIAPEGIYTAKFFIIFAIAFYIFNRHFAAKNISFLFSGLTVLFLFLSLFSLFFFRDPERKIIPDENILYSPADGKIIKIVKKDGNLIVKIFMSVFNTHIQRMPVSGEVNKIEYSPGLFINAMDDKADSINERNKVFFTSGNGLKFSVKQIAGLIARRIKFYYKVNDTIKQGEKIGIIYFGSQVDVEFPESDIKLFVKEGDNTFAGITKIGSIVR